MCVCVQASIFSCCMLCLDHKLAQIVAKTEDWNQALARARTMKSGDSSPANLVPAMHRTTWKAREDRHYEGKLTGLPLTTCSLIGEFLTVVTGGRLWAVQRATRDSFKGKMLPSFVVGLVRPGRLTGVRSPTLRTDCSHFQLHSETELVVAIDVPLDIAGHGLTEKLYAALPGPKDMWVRGGQIVGLCPKKPRGSFEEFHTALEACAGPALRYASAMDYRIARLLSTASFYREPRLQVLHATNANDTLSRMHLHGHTPRGLAFPASCHAFVPWARKHETMARCIEVLGDIWLNPLGLFGEWRGARCPYIKKLGLAITTHRHWESDDWWKPRAVAEDLLRCFPAARQTAAWGRGSPGMNSGSDARGPAGSHR